MTDRELLELAAKAAGYMPNNNWAWSERAQAFRYRLGGDWIEWNPLENDGDALRLAVKLKMTLDLTQLLEDTIFVGAFAGRAVQEVTEKVGDDPAATTRRAIVRAAAEIGRNMK